VCVRGGVRGGEGEGPGEGEKDRSAQKCVCVCVRGGGMASSKEVDGT